MVIEGVIATRQRSNQREFLLKVKGMEPVWQPESNTVLKPHFDHYFEMMNCTFDYYPAVLATTPRPRKKAEVGIEKGELVLRINGKRMDWRVMVAEERSAVLGELESICHKSIKRDQK